MGKAAEYLIAAACVLSTRGELNVSMSMVDDEGVDLVFHRRDGVATLAVQVKARMSDSQDVQNESMVAFVRSQTFRKRADLDILFVAIDIERGAVLKAWLVPSADFAEVIGEPDTRGRLRFVASMKEGSQDRWAHRRVIPGHAKILGISAKGGRRHGITCRCRRILVICVVVRAGGAQGGPGRAPRSRPARRTAPTGPAGR
jgi:hypothetical protein